MVGVQGTFPAAVRPPFGHLDGGVVCDRMGSALPLDAEQPFQQIKPSR